MQKIIIIVLVLICIISCSTKVNDIDLCFQGYKKAVLAEDGKSAYNYLDTNTKNYYAEMLSEARNCKAWDLDDKSVLDQLMIVTLRQRLTKENLNTFDSKQLIIWAVNNGMIGKKSVAEIEIKNIIQDGTQAYARLYIKGLHHPLMMQYFNKEDQQWKIDLTSIFYFTERRLLKLSSKYKYRRQFIYDIVGTRTAEPVNPRIWNGMLK